MGGGGSLQGDETVVEKKFYCTGPICGKKKDLAERSMVKTPGTYCSDCGRALSSEAKSRGSLMNR